MLLNNLFSRAFNKKHPLTRHTFFSTINRITSYSIYRLPIENELKKRIVIFYLKLLFERIEKLMEDCITNLETFDIDSVIFTYLGDNTYAIKFARCGTYEKFYGITDNNDESENL